MNLAILAGGSGIRLWPLSREARPKQFLPLLGEQSLLQRTWEQVRPLLPPERVWVCTAAPYADATRRHLPELRPANLLLEPVARGTGPAVALVNAVISARSDDPIIATMAADLVVRRPEVLRAALQAGEAWLHEHPDTLVTLGIVPTRAETGFGYIEAGEALIETPAGCVHAVHRFVEKPDAATAERYLAEGRHLWNGAYFMWHRDHMTALLRRHLPEVVTALESIAAHGGTPAGEVALRQAYAGFPKVAVEPAIVERAERVVVVPVDMGWSDISTWRSVWQERLADAPNSLNNVVDAEAVVVESDGCLVVGDKRLVALLGVRDLVVVDTEDALLICDRRQAGRVKEVIDGLRNQRRDDLV